MFWAVLLACAPPSWAQDEEIIEEMPPQQVMVEVKLQTAEIAQVNDDLRILIAFMRDQDLAAQGFAPAEWEQPAFELYETELSTRPSMLPYESFMEAVEAGICSPDDGIAYALWVAEQVEAE